MSKLKKLTCPSCGHEEECWLNMESAYECSKCDCFHNGCGQELRPRDEWEESIYEEDY